MENITRSEIARLRRIEAKCIERLDTRVMDGNGGDFCAFCFRSFGHTPDCVEFLVRREEESK